MKKPLNDFLEEYLREYLKLSPILGSHLGLPEYDGMMPKDGREGMEERLQLLKSTKAELDSLDRDKLPDDEAIDVQAMTQTLEEQIWGERELPFIHSFPEGAHTVSSALYLIFSRDYMPLAERLEKLSLRLSEVPAYLIRSRELIDDPVRLWVKTDMMASAHIPSFIDTIERAAVESGFGAQGILSERCRKAKEAIAEHEKWLEKDLMPRSRENFAIGKEKFEGILDRKHLSTSSSELLELGDYYLRTTRERIADIAARIDSSLSYEEIKDRIRSKHPSSFDEVLEFCRGAMQRARKYVIDSGFADVPPDEELLVKETPELFRHHTPLAAYFPPGKFQRPQRGVYIVTRTDDVEVMKDFNYTALFNKSIHEAYPGHHLQFVCCNRHPSFGRILTGGAEFTEGWAHYCEDFVAQNGFPEDLELQFTMCLELIWKACRIIIDVKLSCGDMTPEEAVKMLMDVASFTRPSASSEVQRYTYTPTYQLSYLYGKHLIMEMKKDFSEKFGSAFNLREFHNLMLHSGNLPLNIMRKLIESHFSKAAGTLSGENGSGSVKQESR